MFFLFILIIFLIVGYIIHTSKIRLQIENLEIDTEQSKGKKINQESKITAYLLILEKIKLFKIDIKKIDKKKIKISKNMNINIKYKDILSNKNTMDIEKLDFKLQIGTEDAALTAIIVGTLASTIGIFLKKANYEVIPIYLNKNFLKIKLDCIISIYLMQYIYKLIYNKINNLGNKFLNKKVEV